MIGWFGTAMLCYVTPKEHLGLPDRDDVKTASSPTRSPPTPPTSPRATPPPNSATTPSPAPASNSAGKTSSTCRSTPKPPSKFHDATLPKDAHKVAHFCSMCGPKFCSMKITADVREYAAKLNDPSMSAPGEAGGSGSPRSGETKGAANEEGTLAAEREKGMADMSAKFAATGGELYVSESGKKREAID